MFLPSIYDITKDTIPYLVFYFWDTVLFPIEANRFFSAYT